MHREDYVSGLHDELAGLLRSGDQERADLVRAEMERLGVEVAPTVKRAVEARPKQRRAAQ